MANLVSIDWSVEEFRRLISEQSKSSDAGSSVETTVDVLETIDRVPILENGSSRAAEAASERSVSLLATQVVTQKKDRSSDPTVADVMALQAAGSDKPISSPEADRVRNIALHILNPEVAQPYNMLDRASNAENAASSEVEIATPDPGTEDKRTASAGSVKPDVRKAPEVPERPMIAPLVFAEARKVELRSPLHKAVVEPDVHTSRADRERAIELRWILRDIKGNRLKWSPLCETDLKILIEFDLVEMKNGMPQLTVAGLGVI